MSDPLISVIIPSRDSADTIGNAVMSIANQTYKNLEILVIDDNGTDSTKDAVLQLATRDPRIKYLRLDQEDPNRFDKKLNRNINAGYAARNFGFKHVMGELVTFQDADDVSLLNRIEVQYKLLKKYSAWHLSLNWVPYDSRFLGKQLDVEAYEKAKSPRIYEPDELYTMAACGRGILTRLFPKLHSRIHFYYKRKRLIHRLFFGTYESYPGAGNSPLFKREILEKVQFRKLSERIWPTFMGRGADRDFNWNVAHTFRKSYVILIPLYMWNNRSNTATEDISPYVKP